MALTNSFAFDIKLFKGKGLKGIALCIFFSSLGLYYYVVGILRSSSSRGLYIEESKGSLAMDILGLSCFMPIAGSKYC